MNKKVFVVIVTYNGAHWMDKNISSLLQSQYPVEIIVADNCSTDDTIAIVEKYPQVNLLKMASNLGFGKTNNIGMKHALEQGADYIFLLNQDAWVFEGTIGNLISKMEANPKIGLMSPMHYDGTENNLDESFKTYYGRRRGKTGHNIVVVPFVNAAAWMLTKECVEKVGYFEPLFGHYGEDRNYCDRVTYHKFLIGIDEDSRIIHDRVIKRNFKKDIIQCRYKVLTALLDINHSLGKSYLQGLKEVFGLPKYFKKFYGIDISIHLFFNLLGYYIQMVFNVGSIKTARNNAK